MEKSAEVTILPVRVQLPGKSRQIYPTLVGLDAKVYASQEIFALLDPSANVARVVRGLAQGKHILITSVIARQYGVGKGDVLKIATPKGPRRMKVTGVAVDYTDNGFALFVDRRFLVDVFGIREVGLVALRLSKGVRAEKLQKNITRLEGLSVQSGVALRKQVMTLVDQAMGAFDLLIWLAAMIGFLAIGTVMFQSGLERRKDIAALRSLGMSRKQVRTMMR